MLDIYFFIVISVAEHDTIKQYNVIVLRCLGWVRQVSCSFILEIGLWLADSLSRRITSDNYLPVLQSKFLFSVCLQ